MSSGRATMKGLGALIGLTVLFGVASSAAQAAPVLLGTSSSFAVLAGSTVTNTGPSNINGNVGVSPGTSVIGFPPGMVNGTIHAADGVATQAQADLLIAYNDAAGRSSTATISADPTGSTLTPGVYTSASSIGISGDLTLDAQGDPSAVFVFQAGSTLLGGPGSRILLQGGAQACNVYWQVGSSATIETGSAFAGNILALTSIEMHTGATLAGRALARNGAVTLDTNDITKAECAPWATDVTGTTTEGTPVVLDLEGGDEAGADVTYEVTDAPDHGDLGPIDQATGEVTYTPDDLYTGPDSFTYEVTSSNGTSTPASGSITVTPLDDTPVGVPGGSGDTTQPGTTVALTPRAKAKKKLKRKNRKKKNRRPPAFTG